MTPCCEKDPGGAHDSPMVACEFGTITETLEGTADVGSCCPGPARASGQGTCSDSHPNMDAVTGYVCWTGEGNNMGKCTPPAAPASTMTCEIGHHVFHDNSIDQTSSTDRDATDGSADGSYSSETCRPCEFGKYQNITNTTSTFCHSCHPGEFQNEQGQKSCKICKIGYYSGFKSSENCNECPSGYYSEASQSEHCKHCPEGWSSGSNAACVQDVLMDCPVGTFVAKEDRKLAGDVKPESNDSSNDGGSDGSSTNNDDGSRSTNNDDGSRSTNDDGSSSSSNNNNGRIILPAHCSVCDEGMYSDQINSESCQTCGNGIVTKNTTTGLPYGCGRPGDVSLKGNVGLKYIVLTPKGLLFVHNKSHPITSTECGVAFIHPYYWEMLTMMCTSPNVFVPTCSWHDNNQIGYMQMLDTNVVQTKTNSNVNNITGICNISQMKISVGDPLFSPISHHNVNISTLQSYCTLVNQEVHQQQELCQTKHDKDSDRCSCVNELMTTDFHYEHKICAVDYPLVR